MKSTLKSACFIFISWFITGTNPCVAAVFVVSNTNDSGAGSLRTAITNSNASGPGPNSINCPITGTITLLSNLPVIDIPLSINGPSSGILEITKPGFAGNLFVPSGTLKPAVALNDITFLNLYLTSVIYNQGGLTVNRCIFRNNNSCHILSNNANCTLNNCSFYSNTDCIGIFFSSSAIGTSFINRISNCSFYNNTSVSSGVTNCINSGGPSMILTNCTFANNSSGAGAAVFLTALSNGKSSAVNCTFYGNAALTGAGGAIFTNTFRSLRLENCIVIGNTAATTGQDMNGIDSSVYGHNIIGNSAGVLFRGSTAGNITGVAPSVVLSTTMSNNGGLTKTLALIAGSPAIDGASPILAPANDQRNYVRVGNADIGAFEFGGNIPLPVQLLSFDGNFQNNSVLLNWQTAVEINADKFIIEKSSDARNWDIFSVVNAKGNTGENNQYACMDQKLTSPLNYYKLLQQDKDGEVAELKVLAVRVKTKNQGLVYPTVVHDSKIYVHLKESTGSSLMLNISDISGRIVQHQFLDDQLYTGQPFEIILNQELMPGIYFVNLDNTISKIVIAE